MVRTPCVHLFVCFFWKQIQEPCPQKGFLWDRLAKLLRKRAVKWNCCHSHLGRCVPCIKSILFDPMVMGDCQKMSMVLIFRSQHLARLNLSAKWGVSIQLRKHSNRNIHQKKWCFPRGISYNFFRWSQTWGHLKTKKRQKHEVFQLQNINRFPLTRNPPCLTLQSKYTKILLYTWNQPMDDTKL